MTEKNQEKSQDKVVKTETTIKMNENWVNVTDKITYEDGSVGTSPTIMSTKQ